MPPDSARRRLLRAAGAIAVGGIGASALGVDDRLYDRIACGRRITPTWRYRGQGRRRVYYLSPPVVVDNSLLVSTAWGVTALDKSTTLVRIDAETRDTDWTFTNESEGIGTPRVDDNRLYVGTGANRVFALDPDSGDELWRHDAGGAGVAGVGIWRQPALVEDLVAVGQTYSSQPDSQIGDMDDHQHRVLALDRTTGTERWTTPVGGAVFGGLTPVDSDLLVTTEAGEFMRLDGSTGEKRWTVKLTHDIPYAPIVAGDIGYVTDGHSLVAVSVGDGSRQWTVRTEATVPTADGTRAERPITAGPAATDTAALVGTAEGAVVVYDRVVGEESWRQPIADTDPITVVEPDDDGTTAFAATQSGRISGLDLSNERRTARPFFVENRAQNRCGLTVARPRSLATTTDALFVNTEHELSGSTNRWSCRCLRTLRPW